MTTTAVNIEVGYGVAQGKCSYTAGCEAAGQALATVRSLPVAAVLVFASVAYSLEDVLAGIASVAGGAPILGATTAGEICDGLHSRTVTVVVLASPYLKVHFGIGTNVAGDWRRALAEAAGSSALRPFFKGDPAFRHEMLRKGKEVFAVLFSPGNTRQNQSRSFEILEQLKTDSLGRFPIFGGSAADNWEMETNYILAGGKAYPDSLLLAIFETELQFGITISHGFRPTSVAATVTGVDELEILTLDGQPAADQCSRMLGVSRRELEGKQLTYTTGRTFGIADAMGQYSINTASFLTERGGVRLGHPVASGSILTLMESDPETMVRAGARAIRKAVIRGGVTDIALGLVSYCASRPKLMGERTHDEIAGMMKTLDGKPLVGFCSFGEQGVGDSGVCRHANSSVACLVLGSELSQMARVARENEELLAKLKRQTITLSETNRKLEDEAVERARAEEALRQAHANLEIKVLQRTEELLALNQELLATSDQLQNVNRDLHSQIAVRELAEEQLAEKNRELGQAYNELKNAQAHIIQQEKMASIGQLAAGVAHEINNPMAFVISNLDSLKSYLIRLSQHIALQDEALDQLAAGPKSAILAELRENKEIMKIDHLLRDIDDLIEDALQGSARVKNIVQDLRGYARSEGEDRLANINDGLESTLNIIGSEIKYKIELEKDFGDIPLTKCNPGQLGQVFMNILINAAQAIDTDGRIKIATRAENGKIIVTVADTGCGIPPEIQGRIFEPFFTTKEVGKGTGLGLSISYDIVKKHGGEITVHSQSGHGTTFTVTIPVVS